MSDLRKEPFLALPKELRGHIDEQITARLIAFYEALVKRRQISHLPEIREDGTPELELFPKPPRSKQKARQLQRRS